MGRAAQAVSRVDGRRHADAALSAISPRGELDGELLPRPVQLDPEASNVALRVRSTRQGQRTRQVVAGGAGAAVLVRRQYYGRDVVELHGQIDVPSSLLEVARATGDGDAIEAAAMRPEGAHQPVGGSLDAVVHAVDDAHASIGNWRQTLRVTIRPSSGTQHACPPPWLWARIAHQFERPRGIEIDNHLNEPAVREFNGECVAVGPPDGRERVPTGGHWA